MYTCCAIQQISVYYTTDKFVLPDFPYPLQEANKELYQFCVKNIDHMA